MSYIKGAKGCADFGRRQISGHRQDELQSIADGLNALDTSKARTNSVVKSHLTALFGLGNEKSTKP